MCMECNENVECNENIETMCNEKTEEVTSCCSTRKQEQMPENSENAADEQLASTETHVCPHCKHTQRDEAQKKLLQNRLRRIEGQVRGLQSMLDQDAYCNDILVQSAAVSAALSAFNRELLENHIRHCVARDIREGKDEVIDELMGTLKKLMK